MSEIGDVIWADDQAWMLTLDAKGNMVWLHPSTEDDDVTPHANSLAEFSDFRWVVKDGELLIVDNEDLDEEDWEWQLPLT